MKQLSRWLLALALLGATSPALAQWSITLFAGYGGGGGVDNVTTNTEAEFDNAATYGLALGFPYDAAREGQIYFSQQSTTLSPGGSAAPFDVTIRYLHLGGTAFLGASPLVQGPVDRGFYVVGGFGITHFRPGTSGYGDELKPSFNLGLGYLLPLGPNIALRAETRGYLTLVNSSGGFLCSGGCVVVLKSDAFTQLEAKLGLTARF